MTTHDPGYDFFATGAPRPAGEPVPPRFATSAPSAEPTPAPAATSAPAFGAAPGYATGAVNQFGTPLDTPVVPTGPYAAPGIGAAPTAGPGLVSTWDPAPPASPASPTSSASSASSASAWAAAPGSHRAAVRAAQRPGTVLAAGIIAIVVGALGLVLGLVGLIAYSALRSELSAFVDAPELAAADLDITGLTTMMLVGALVLVASGALYLVAGIATTVGRRWGAWTLLAVSALSIVVTLIQMVTGSGGNGLLGILVSAAVAGLLLTPAAQAWLRSP